MTNASTARQASTCRSGFSSAASSAKFPQYHTSADNLDFIRPEHLAQSYRLIAETLDVIENDAVYCNTMPKCEPQLGKRGLYGAIGGDKDAAAANMAMLWILNLSDGNIRCSTSPSARICHLRLFGAPQSSSGRTGF